MIPDERRDVPSSSELPVLDKCIGSHKTKKAAKEHGLPPRKQDAQATHGNDVHAVVAGEVSADEVSYSAAETAEMCEEQAAQLVQDYFGDSPVNDVREIRLGITATGRTIPVLPESRATFVHTGKFDVLFHHEGRGLLMDFKSLHGEHAHATKNRQLAGLAPMVWDFFKLHSLRVALVQPWKGKPTLADYGPGDIAAARAWLMDLIERERKATPDDRTPGPHCSKCDAVGVCDKAYGHMLQVVDSVETISLPGDSKALFAEAVSRFLRMPAAKHAAYERSRSMAGAVLAALHEASKQRAADDPEFQQFYTLEEKLGNRSLEGNGQEIYNHLAPYNLTPDDMMEAASYSIGTLEEKLRIRSGIKATSKNGAKKYNLTGKEAAAKINEVLAPFINRGADKKVLTPTKSIE